MKVFYTTALGLALLNPATTTAFEADQDNQHAFCGAAVVFESTRDGSPNQREIYISSPDGGFITRLMEDPSDNRLPTVSPDGTKIAFISDRGGEWAIYIEDIFQYLGKAGGAKKLLEFEGRFTQPNFSPDSGSLIFTGITAGGQRNFYIFDLATKNLDQLPAQNLTESYPSFSPDAKSVVFMGRENDTADFEIFTLRLDGTGLKQITDNEGEDEWMPEWSPDGTKIAFHAQQMGEVFVYDLETGSLENVTNHPAHDTDPSWTGDSKSLVFGSFRTGVSNIWTINLETGEARNISQSHHHEGHGDVAWMERCYPFI